MNGVCTVEDVHPNDNDFVLLPFDDGKESLTHISVDSNQIVTDAVLSEYTELELSKDQISSRYIFVPSKMKAYYDGFSNGYNLGYLKAFQNIDDAVKEIISMQDQAGSEITEIRKEICDLNASFSSNMKESEGRLAALETDVKYIRDGIDDLKKATEDLPLLAEIVRDLKVEKDKKSNWWSNSIWGPVVSGIVVGLVLIAVKLLFHI